MLAVARGARVDPGRFWNLPGTFLFTIYVMTALGFGAPVPQTVYGRTSALAYAVLAVPTHIYLMVNASTCAVVHVESYLQSLKKNLDAKIPFIISKNNSNKTGSPNCCRNSNDTKPSHLCNIRRKIKRSVSCVWAGRCVPLAAVLYYVCGTLIFGVFRNKLPLEVIMFPLEFTTSGGLEHVDGHIRILYGFYVEGAMSLLACALATLRRHSTSAFDHMSEKYRLFATEKDD